MDFQIERRVLVKYTGNGGDVTIPEGVTRIGNQAFEDCSSLTSVTIPEGVTRIGNQAFKDCSSLTSVTIPAGVKSIGDSAFQRCSGLTSVAIPASVTSIGEFAFWVCNNLTSVTIPTSVTSIGNHAFSGCGLTSVTIPEGTSIGDYAFSSCSLTSVTIPEGVSIGKEVFYKCPDLTSVTIRAGVSIGESAFLCCYGLTSVTIPEGKIYIEPYAFDECSSLKEVYYTGSLASWVSLDKYWGDTPLRYGAVLYCNGEPIQDDLVIPVGVKSIGYNAFEDCSSLTSVTIPASVTSIGDRAFDGCSSLTSVTIPEGVTSIGEYAFMNCTGLSSLTIPESVTSIGKDAFRGCNSLKKILVPDISLLPKEQQPIACISIVKEKGEEPESDMFKASVAYIKKQRAKTDFIDIAIRTPELLIFMCREKLITAAGFDQYWEAAEMLGDPAVTAMLLDYRQNGLGTKKLESARNAQQKKQDKDEDLIITKAMRRANAEGIQGLVFAITGKLYTFVNREAAKKEIERLGGRLASGVTANVDYLITNDTNSDSAKNKRAADLGIEVISEGYFNHLIKRL